jgi:AcrR family transcriptional regulator
MTKERIKEAAMMLFTQKGYDAASMNEIAQNVGIRVSSIYSHFKTKEELFFEVSKDI